jgi:hypothetical protein
MVMLNVSDFYRVVNKIGYTMHGPTVIMWEILYEINAGNDHLVVVPEAFFMHHTPHHVVAFLDQIVGQHHVLCKACVYPLLMRVNIDRAAYLAQNSARPTVTYECDNPELAAQMLNKFIVDPSAMLPYEIFKMQLDPSISAAVVTEYRDTRQGPDSRILERCPRCHQELTEDTVREVVESPAL